MTFLTKLKWIIGAAFMVPSLAMASQPTPGGINFQEPATELAKEVQYFHELILMPIITLISLFVLALLIWIVVRYNRKANPVASKTSHHVGLEIAWTIIPVFILLFISLFSFDLLFKEDVIPDGKIVTYEADGTEYVFPNDFAASRKIKRAHHLDVFKMSAAGEKMLLKKGNDYTLAGLGDDEIVVSLTSALGAGNSLQLIGGKTRTGEHPLKALLGGDKSAPIATAPTITFKATGYQWGWNYAYPDFGDFEFDALMTPEADVADPALYRLATSNDIVVPVGETVRVITTARDVIHAWAMPAFAVKIDAVPGRLNETWFNATKTGTYYGQCSEICGLDHAFMPISLRVVTRPEFEAWVSEQQALAGLEQTFETQERLAGAADTAAAVTAQAE